jgi:hypothetical protein
MDSVAKLEYCVPHELEILQRNWAPLKAGTTAMVHAGVDALVPGAFTQVEPAMLSCHWYCGLVTPAGSMTMNTAFSPAIFVCEAGWEASDVGGVQTVRVAEAEVSGNPQLPVTMHRYFVPLMVGFTVKVSAANVPPVGTLAHAVTLSCH